MKNNTPFFKIISIIGIISIDILFLCSIAFSAPQDVRVPLLFSRSKEYKNIKVQIEQRIKALYTTNPGLTSLLIEEEANIKSKSLGRYIRNLVIKPRDEGWFHRLLKALDRLEAGKPDWINLLRIRLSGLTWQQLKRLNVYTIEELQNIPFEDVANFGSNSIREIEQLRIKSGGMGWLYPYRSSEDTRIVYLTYYGYSPSKITRRFDSERKGMVKAMANREQIRKMPEKVTFYDFSEEMEEADALVSDPLSSFFPMLLLERLEKAQMLYWQVQAGLQTYDGIVNESKNAIDIKKVAIRERIDTLLDKLHAKEIKVSNELSVIKGKINRLLNKLYAEERAVRELRVEVNRLIKRDGMPLYLRRNQRKLFTEEPRETSISENELHKKERKRAIKLYLTESIEDRIRLAIVSAGGKMPEASREYYGERYNESSPGAFWGLVYRHNLSGYARGIRELMRDATKAGRRAIDSQI